MIRLNLPGLFVVLLAAQLQLGCATAGGSSHATPPARASARSAALTSTAPSEDQLWRWGYTVMAAANRSTMRVVEWWNSEDVAGSGVLPYVPVSATPIMIGGQEHSINVLSIETEADKLTFVCGEARSTPFESAPPRPRTLNTRGRAVPVVGGEGSFEGAPQSLNTLAGIVSAFHFVKRESVRPGCIREDLLLEVPAPTILALQSLAPIEVRVSNDGEVAFLFTKDSRPHAFIRITRELEPGRGVSGTLLLDLTGPLSHLSSDPRTWPLLVGSLAEL